MKKWSRRWDATYLLNDVPLDSSTNDTLFQCQHIMTWGDCGSSCFTHYSIYFAPNYKIILFAEWESYTHQNMLEPILLPESFLRWDLAHTHYDVRCGNCVRSIAEKNMEWCKRIRKKKEIKEQWNYIYKKNNKLQKCTED